MRCSGRQGQELGAQATGERGFPTNEVCVPNQDPVHWSCVHPVPDDDIWSQWPLDDGRIVVPLLSRRSNASITERRVGCDRPLKPVGAYHYIQD